MITALPCRGFIAKAGLYALAFPIRVVDLELHEFDLRVERKQFIERFSRVVERKTDMFYKPFFFLLPDETPGVHCIGCRDVLIA